MQPMNHLDRLEALAERFIEGAFHRLFSNRGKQKRIETKEVAAAAPKMAGCWQVRLEQRLLDLTGPVINLGRALDNDIVLNDPTVSRYHAQLRWRQGQYYLYPPGPIEERVLASAGGQTLTLSQAAPHTLLNQQPVVLNRPSCLASGDEVTLGQTTLTIEWSG